MTMLAVDAIDVFIQSSHILRKVSLEVGRDEVVCLVGRNGAGKTTALRTIMGYLHPRAGRVELAGRPIHDYWDLTRAEAWRVENELRRWAHGLDRPS